MGLLINGTWHDDRYDPEQPKGEYIRPPAQFINWITVDGQPGPTGTGGFPAESGRYHLYASYASPWAHRTMILRQLKDLTPHISMSILHPQALARGWEFVPTHPLYRDHINFCRCLYEIYLLADPFYSGQVTLPVLWDKITHTIVSNESADIMRMFNAAFNGITQNTLDFYPDALRPQIDEVNQEIYIDINNGVYQAGFATKQSAYDTAVDALFEALERMDRRVENQSYLVANTLTEADWRLFPTLIRFDSVYYSLFKCNLFQIRDYKNLSRYIDKLYNVPGIAQTVNIEQIKQHYYGSLPKLNPTLIVPKGPMLYCKPK